MRNLVQDEPFSIYSYLNKKNTLLAADLDFESDILKNDILEHYNA